MKFEITIDETKIDYENINKQIKEKTIEYLEKNPDEIETRINKVLNSTINQVVMDSVIDSYNIRNKLNEFYLKESYVVPIIRDVVSQKINNLINFENLDSCEKEKMIDLFYDIFKEVFFSVVLNTVQGYEKQFLEQADAMAVDRARESISTITGMLSDRFGSF